MTIHTVTIPILLILILLTGCDDRATQIAREAADRQAQQNTMMAELNKEVAHGSQQLVAADANARTEMMGVHRDLQAERVRLDTGRNELESDRRQLASQRRTESLLVPIFQALGGIFLVALLLWFCRQVLASDNNAQADELLQDLLVTELMNHDRLPLLPVSEPRQPKPLRNH